MASGAIRFITYLSASCASFGAPAFKVYTGAAVAFLRAKATWELVGT
jgi:hypothetical protein